MPHRNDAKSAPPAPPIETDCEMDFRRKYIRRPAEEYRGHKRVFLTFCCDHRQPYFSQPAAAEWILHRFREIAMAHASLAHAWCAMPDHLHVFVEGTSESSDALRFASDFKQRTGFEWSAKERTRLWQPRFYDHIVRSSEDCERVVFYIWSNPVRKGICTDILDYKYSGSDTVPFARSAIPQPLWIPPWREPTPKSTPAGLKPGATKP